MTAGPDWTRDGADWPNREASRFVQAAGLTWHVQRMGRGPALLLLHGTGAATHSWRGLVPLLAPHFTVIAPDLPGHGFTERPLSARLSLPAMARALAGLLRALDVAPVLAAGHSAGAAILVRMCVDGDIAPRALVSLNGAMLPLRGAPGHIFMPVAKLMASLPMVPRIFARSAADPATIARLLSGTGSTLDAEGVKLYGRLARNPGHVAGALGMMANWDLRPIERDLSRLKTPLILITGSADRTIPPTDSARVQARVAGSTLITMAGLGHLAHEERPGDVAAILIRLVQTQEAV